MTKSVARHTGAVCGAVLTLLVPAAAAATSTSSGALPWDQPLDILATFISGPCAHFFIVTSLIAAGFLYAVGGSSEVAKRFARVALGGAFALGAVRLLNYLLPY
jgi:type IV secretory pathway VirB2 component (pilin)